MRRSIYGRSRIGIGNSKCQKLYLEVCEDVKGQFNSFRCAECHYAFGVGLQFVITGQVPACKATRQLCVEKNIVTCEKNQQRMCCAVVRL